MTAQKRAPWSWQSFFGEDGFYLEIQNHGIPDEARAEGLIRLHRDTGIPSS